MVLGSTGCLITEKPEFDAPRQVGPFLRNFEPSPAGAQVIAYEPESTVFKRNKKIEFDIVSEDLGQDLTALAVFDFKGLNGLPYPLVCDPITINAGTLHQAKRDRVSCPIDLNNIVPAVGKGCYTIGVVVSHQFKAASLQPVVDRDVTIATWFYQVGVDESVPEPNKYFPCEPVPTPQDAGVDARAEGGGI